ncbi:creatininase family protein [Gluconacetobacter entanii]|uniref:creatininase family protein n=1 Tax=Gluconacetobacter entanii TaxID=108528 RepID=UPI001C93309B|nr:creatininase family protein [Gluconacetobacter entanii]MBY4641596.1 creatininase family protein [Gluconacetobacter entanii]MCW4579370.1 creatininase family protein [Gluconacetobacter entanii]MCW4582750.1 creatininase family protein [Gluconacetobacter entanii]MCW4586164.1 creatininase family protein [Gluconacetobacter entanii]
MKHAPEKICLAELTAEEARTALAANPVIILPLGSQEDQGPHSPMGDYLCADAIARRVAQAARARGIGAYVAPVLPYGGADYFGSVIGGIALEQATLRAVLTDMMSCLLRHGLTRIIVFNGHGGNAQAVHDVTLSLRHRQGVVIPCVYLWSIASAMLADVMGDADAAQRSAGHGGNPLSSVAMALFPDLVRPDLRPAPAKAREFMGLPINGFATAQFEGASINFPLEIDEIATKGVAQADPRLCSAATGQALVERLTTLGADLVAHLVKENW